jgi:hypothetical protein
METEEKKEEIRKKAAASSRYYAFSISPLLSAEHPEEQSRYGGRATCLAIFQTIAP